MGWVDHCEFVYQFPVAAYIYGDFCHSHVPMVSTTITDIHFLLEIESILTDETCRRVVEEDTVVVEIVDTVWESLSGCLRKYRKFLTRFWHLCQLGFHDSLKTTVRSTS